MSPEKDKPQDSEKFLLNDISNRLAKLEKKFLNDAREKNKYRKAREEKEGETQQKIEAIYKNTTSVWFFVRDRILPAIIIAAILKWLFP